MHEFIRKIFGGNKPVVKTISVNTIPVWITERETAARSALLSDTAELIRTIRNAAAQLQSIVNTLEGAEHDPGLHPKIRSIAKNSLPLFVKAMTASLAKELPGRSRGVLYCSHRMRERLPQQFPGTGPVPPGGLSGRDEERPAGYRCNGPGDQQYHGISGKYRKEMQDLASVRSDICDS